ncbi:MAG: hypothetical protein ACE5HS_12960 [bacterium]
MDKKYFVLLIAVLGVCFTSGTTYLLSSSQQEISALKDENLSLLPLVGQKCKLLLKNGDDVKGTLWDIGNDFVVMKVKKGLLYSKAEKFYLTEIDYIEDKDGGIIKISDLKTKSPTTEKPESSQTPKLYFQTEDLIDQKPKKNPKPTPRAVQKPAEEPEKTPDEFQDLFKPEVSRESLESEIDQEATVSDPTKPEIKVPEVKKPQLVIVEPKSLSKSKSQARTKKAGSQQKLRPESMTATEAIEPIIATPTEIDYPDASAIALEKSAKQIRILKYQNVILFAVTVFTIALTIFLKVIGLKSPTYGKFSLFPAHLIKKNGKFGVIDQGSEDGVKPDDIIRLYKKDGRNIIFKGKVLVIKVAENYSAVEMLKSSRGNQLEVGDVGFRERNFLLTTFKKLRIVTSLVLGVLAKLFNYAAKNLEVEEKEPAINYGVFRKETAATKSKEPESKKVNKRNQNAKVESRPKPKTKMVTQPQDAPPKAPKVIPTKNDEKKDPRSRDKQSSQPEMIGFGLEDD